MLERIQVPTLVLAGDRDLVVCESSLTALAEGISRSKVVRLPGCGPLAFATQPRLMADAVKHFFAI